MKFFLPMQLKTSRKYIREVISEGNRLQKLDDTGNKTTKGRFTSAQIISVLLASGCAYLLPKGFSDDFSGYVIGFLGIFVGLFTTIVISLQDRSKVLYEKWGNKTETEKIRDRRVRNYIVQFTGLTSYSILLALGVIVLLSMVLLHEGFKTDLGNYYWIHSFDEITAHTIGNFLKVSALVFHRFLTICFLINIFAITTFSTTSYFSYLLREYKNIQIPDA